MSATREKLHLKMERILHVSQFMVQVSLGFQGLSLYLSRLLLSCSMLSGALESQPSSPSITSYNSITYHST